MLSMCTSAQLRLRAAPLTEPWRSQRTSDVHDHGDSVSMAAIVRFGGRQVEVQAVARRLAVHQAPAYARGHKVEDHHLPSPMRAAAQQLLMSCTQ